MKRILVIEDNPANLTLTIDILERVGHEVLSAIDAETGMNIARESMPDLILMDIQLPGTDGLTATRILKNDPLTRHIPIVALTAHAMKGDEEKMLAEGCDGYIAKPIRYKTFIEQIDAFLEMHPA